MLGGVYDRVMGPVERAGLASRRRRLLSGARGHVLEIGAGTGANLPHYPADIDSLTLIEPSEPMRRKLKQAVEDWGGSATILGTVLEKADFDGIEFDTIVSSLTLCSVRDPQVALARLMDALAPEGQILFLEHTTVPGWRHRVQAAADPVWTRLAGGCHLTRDTTAQLRQAGLAITDCDRFRIPYGGVLVGHGVQGRAIRRVRPDSVDRAV